MQPSARENSNTCAEKVRKPVRYPQTKYKRANSNRLRRRTPAFSRQPGHFSPTSSSLAPAHFDVGRGSPSGARSAGPLLSRFVWQSLRTAGRPAGAIHFRNSAVVQDSGEPDLFDPEAKEALVCQMPPTALTFLLPSRYCEVDSELMAFAWEKFGPMTPGWSRVEGICDFVHRHIRFDYQHARSNRTALEARFLSWRLPPGIRAFTLDLLRLHLKERADVVMERITSSLLQDAIQSGYDVLLLIDLARSDPLHAKLRTTEWTFTRRLLKLGGPAEPRGAPGATEPDCCRSLANGFGAEAK